MLQPPFRYPVINRSVETERVKLTIATKQEF